MNRSIRTALLFLVLSGLFACHYMEVLVVDTPNYTISGVVRAAQDMEAVLDETNAKRISGVYVAVRCPGTEKPVTQNRAGKTDKTGFYELEGYWDLDGCSLIFEHNEYEPEVIVIDEQYLISSEESVYVYELDVRLEPR